MEVLNTGECILLKNLIFEENQADIKNGHPGMVIIPTDESDEVVYCIHMTSDKQVYNRDRDKFYICNNLLKKSYINLKHIIKTQNCYRKILRQLDEIEYIQILKELYNYQTEHGETGEFKEIKEDIEIILELYEMSKDNDDIVLSVENLKMLKSIPKNYRQLALYVKYKCDIPSEDTRYAMQIIRVKEKLMNYIKVYKKGDYSKTKQFYSDLKIFNGNNLEQSLQLALALIRFDNNNKEYYQLIDIVGEDIRRIIKEEKERELRMKSRAETKEQNKKAQKELNQARKEKKKRKLLERKYGKFNLEI